MNGLGLVRLIILSRITKTQVYCWFISCFLLSLHHFFAYDEQWLTFSDIKLCKYF